MQQLQETASLFKNNNNEESPNSLGTAPQGEEGLLTPFPSSFFKNLRTAWGEGGSIFPGFAAPRGVSMYMKQPKWWHCSSPCAVSRWENWGGGAFPPPAASLWAHLASSSFKEVLSQSCCMAAGKHKKINVNRWNILYSLAASCPFWVIHTSHRLEK